MYSKAVRVLKVRYCSIQNIQIPAVIKMKIQLIRPGMACLHFQDCHSNESSLHSFAPPVWSRSPARTKCNQQCVRPLISKEVNLHTGQVAYQAGAYPRLCSMKQLAVFLLLPGWDASP